MLGLCCVGLYSVLIVVVWCFCMVVWFSEFLLVILLRLSDGGVLISWICVMNVDLLFVFWFSVVSYVVNVVCMVGVCSMLVIDVFVVSFVSVWYVLICGNISKLMLLWLILVMIMFCMYGVFVDIVFVCNGLMLMNVLLFSLKFLVSCLLNSSLSFGCVGLVNMFVLLLW